jgi:EAL domain-containing protein (putative c-di-GMP-specific phosphodiesterase class I)
MSDQDSTAVGDAVASHGGALGARDIHAVKPQREIREALNDSRLVVHYQPILRLDNFEINGVEALLRWALPDGVLLTPDDFLPSVSQTPIMREITRHVLCTACSEAVRWSDWTVSVNVAATDVVHPAFVDEVTATLEATHLPPNRLALELTEQSVLLDVTQAITNLERLRSLGVEISLDDFGTGYSSLLYLRTLPVTRVKIDQLFIQALGNSEDDAAIVESVVRLAHTINVDVTAEGVETPEQVAFLQSIGCGDAQGFLFGRPRPASSLSSATTSDWVGSPPRKAFRRRRPETDAATLTKVRALLAEGASLHTVAAALNKTGATTHLGARWSARSVARIVADLPDPT